MSDPIDQMVSRMLDRLLEAGAAWARPSIPSTTLQQSLETIVDDIDDGVAKGRLYIDQYWAIYVHDGRESTSWLSFFRDRNKPLIWFRNVNDDPRLAPNGVITRYDEWRPLTKQEFRYWNRRNREAIKYGLPPPMVIHWGDVKAVHGSFFFDNRIGMAGFRPIADNIIREELLNYLSGELKEVLSYSGEAIRMSL